MKRCDVEGVISIVGDGLQLSKVELKINRIDVDSLVGTDLED